MKVRIVRACMDTVWYRNHIGEIFDVFPEEPNNLYTFGRYVLQNQQRVIYVEDAVVIGE